MKILPSLEYDHTLNQSEHKTHKQSHSELQSIYIGSIYTVTHYYATYTVEHTNEAFGQ